MNSLLSESQRDKSLELLLASGLTNPTVGCSECAVPDHQIKEPNPLLCDQADELEIECENIAQKQNKVNEISLQLSDTKLDLGIERDKVRQLRRDMKLMKRDLSDKNDDIKHLEKELLECCQTLTKQRRASCDSCGPHKLASKKQQKSRTSPSAFISGGPANTLTSGHMPRHVIGRG